MTPWAYLAVHDLAGFASAVVLVETGHPWWAGLCFFLVLCTTITEINTRRGARG